ncbi:alpha-L-arabinofuranosidase [Phototrophicus methaneseepsis]|uniref:non-reducing end alpha-L-arabinofuranosidase n=1 Tax=Phototrophicus methaneseepsis TaxID=2710758 RepID=A0A7S8E7X6_9CHLR|nr:alpha-L-arabinofuranosidase C-terminal domain-containing protein [Phototrophicus methaneseepsis]QPC82030.1 alpha-L-arabinofuranosidase [Phototrophicus methaneseepsis]
MSYNIEINPTPRFEKAPTLYMQFMEPLGTTDSSVEAAWDFTQNRWRPQFIELLRELGPGCIRWGGILTSFWKWREGIGSRDQRKPMLNYLWGGLESNQVGIHEILDLCQQVQAEPLMAVNFAADGRPAYINTVTGEKRAGTAEEAAELVSYCNDPDHPERSANGQAAPWGINLWQIGNETSYPKGGQRFTMTENAQKYLEFAKAMRARDNSIQLVGWGDEQRDSDEWWAPELLATAGEYVDYVAVHMMHQHPKRENTILISNDYAHDYDCAWEELDEIYDLVETKLTTIRQIVEGTGSDAKLAITEGHLSLKPHNTNPLLYEWLSGLYHARIMALYERNSDFVKISTLADFFGTRWTVNAVMLGGPHQDAYLMPVGVIMSFFKKYSGEQGLEVPARVGALEFSASRTDDSVYVHIVNTDLHHAQPFDIKLSEGTIQKATVYEIAPGDLSASVDHQKPNTFTPTEHTASVTENQVNWEFPPASVSVVQLQLA